MFRPVPWWLIVTVCLMCFALPGCSTSGARPGSDAEAHPTNIIPEEIRIAASSLARKMIASESFQAAIARAAEIHPADKPYILITRIKNQSTQKLPMAQYAGAPIKAELLKDGKVDIFSEDDALNGRPVREPDLVISGYVGRTNQIDGRSSQGTYKFILEAANRSVEVIWTDQEDLAKAQKRPLIGG